MATWLGMRDGGRLLHDPALYPAEEADALFAWLRTGVPWHQGVIRGRPVPRLNAWYSDSGLRYAYSGLSHVGTGWLPELEPVKGRVEEACGASFNSLLLNLYRDGSDSISYHADDEPELGDDPVVATLSLGSARGFVLKHRESKETLRYRLENGSLLAMAGTSQSRWLHAVPKTAKPVGERISLTFRRIVLS